MEEDRTNCYFYPQRDCPGWSVGGRCERIGEVIPDIPRDAIDQIMDSPSACWCHAGWGVYVHGEVPDGLGTDTPGMLCRECAGRMQWECDKVHEEEAQALKKNRTEA